MKVIDFDNREHVLNFKKMSRSFKKLSAPHAEALSIIEELFNSCKIYNEVTLIGCKGVNGVVLCADIFVPSMNLIVEVHGKQHYEYCEFFHKTKAKFAQYRRNDNIKKEWAELNGIMLVELKYDEQDKWKEQIHNAIY